MNKLRLSIPVIFEMENSQLLQDTVRQICIIHEIIPYPVRGAPCFVLPLLISATQVSFFVSMLLGILHGSI